MEATSDRTAMGRPGNYRRGGFLGKPLVPGRACATADVDLALLKLLSSIPQVIRAAWPTIAKFLPKWRSSQSLRSSNEDKLFHFVVSSNLTSQFTLNYCVLATWIIYFTKKHIYTSVVLWDQWSKKGMQYCLLSLGNTNWKKICSISNILLICGPRLRGRRPVMSVVVLVDRFFMTSTCAFHLITMCYPKILWVHIRVFNLCK